MEKMKEFNVGDEVVFRNIFSLISGRIYSFRENKEGKISGCLIKTIDSALTVVTYDNSVSDLIKRVEEYDLLESDSKMKNFNVGDQVIFRCVFSLFTGRISECHRRGNDKISWYSIKTLDSKFNTFTYQVRAGDALITVRGLDDLVQE